MPNQPFLSLYRYLALWCGGSATLPPKRLGICRCHVPEVPGLTSIAQPEKESDQHHFILEKEIV